MHGGKKVVSVFRISGCYCAPAFQVQESVFDEVTKLVNFLIVKALILTVFLRWNNRYHSIFLGKVDNFAAVITSVSEKIFSPKAFCQGDSLRAISNGAFCDNDSDWHTI